MILAIEMNCIVLGMRGSPFCVLIALFIFVLVIVFND